MNLELLCLEVNTLATEVGKFIRTESENFDLSRIEHKGPSDLVSYVDKQAEKMVVKRLSELLPEAGFITEEGTVVQEMKEYRWVIDPLDGTTNFLHKLPPYSVSIALLKGEEPIIGVVYEVTHKECFYAWKKGGAFCNGKAIHISSIKSLNESLIAAGFPYRMLDKTDAYFRIIKNFVKLSHGVRRLGSAAVDLCYVACGRTEGYFEFNLKVWDIAAGILILQEAGGKVSDFSGGNDYLYGKELLSSGHLHEQMLQVIQDDWKS